MKSKHTPGPWSVQKMSNGDVYVQSSPDTDIARVFIPYPSAGESGEPKVMLEVQQCNSLLIAASPKLLAALKDCITEYGASGMQEGLGRMKRRLLAINDIAREAIALTETHE